MNEFKKILNNRITLILICTIVTVILHAVHSEIMSIIVDCGTFVSIATIALEKDKS